MEGFNAYSDLTSIRTQRLFRYRSRSKGGPPPERGHRGWPYQATRPLGGTRPNGGRVETSGPGYTIRLRPVHLVVYEGGMVTPGVVVRALGAVGLLVALSAPGWAGTWATSVPAGYCVPAASGGPTLGDTSGSSAPTKGAWVFAPAAGGTTLYCDLAFPRSVNSATITVNLTWQSPGSTTSENVCWQAAWEITKAGQAWGSNLAGEVALNTTTATALSSSANVDIRSALSVVARDQTNTVCPTGTSAGTCAGSHGILRIVRTATASCSNEHNGNALLTRIELTGSTP